MTARRQISLKIFLILSVTNIIILFSQAPEGYKLIWSDEFGSNAVNRENWIYRDTTRDRYFISRPENVTVEKGNMKIALKKENYQSYSYTGGGLILKKKFQYGYFETRVKLDGGYGWHEAFWTTWGTNFKLNEVTKTMPRIEIDCFEHYSEYDANQFTYGIIEWYPTQGSVNRDYYNGTEDFVKEFQVFGFEITPHYFNYYLNGKILKTVDISKVAHNEFHLWLSAIATKPDATPAGEVLWDYLRCYNIDLNSAEYKIRKDKFQAVLAAQNQYVKSKGKDLWVEVEDFSKKGGWTVERFKEAIVLIAHKVQNADYTEEQLTAYSRVVIPEAGTYKVWVRTVDYSDAPGTRKCEILVNGENSEKEYGVHGKHGLEWEPVGVYKLKAGYVDLSLYDSAQWFARVDKILLTTDLEYVPEGTGGERNTEHRLW